MCCLCSVGWIWVPTSPWVEGRRPGTLRAQIPPSTIAPQFPLQAAGTGRAAVPMSHCFRVPLSPRPALPMSHCPHPTLSSRPRVLLSWCHAVHLSLPPRSAPSSGCCWGRAEQVLLFHQEFARRAPRGNSGVIFSVESHCSSFHYSNQHKLTGRLQGLNLVTGKNKNTPPPPRRDLHLAAARRQSGAQGSMQTAAR